MKVTANVELRELNRPPTRLQLSPKTRVHACSHTRERKRAVGQKKTHTHKHTPLQFVCTPSPLCDRRRARLTIILKVLRSDVASRWHTGLHPVKLDIAAPCRMVAAAPTAPGAIMKADACAMSAARHATRANVRAIVVYWRLYRALSS